MGEVVVGDGVVEGADLLEEGLDAGQMMLRPGIVFLNFGHQVRFWTVLVHCVFGFDQV